MPDNLGRKFATWFGAGKPSSTAALRHSERRQYARFPSQACTSFESAVGETDDQNQAQVADISQSGVRLLVDQPQEPGALLHVTVPRRGSQSPEILLACVVHADAQPQGWSLGCSFIRELSSKELQAFL